MRCFDFIIVGSGSAGSVVAERLSADGRYSVLVLEAAAATGVSSFPCRSAMARRSMTDRSTGCIAPSLIQVSVALPTTGRAERCLVDRVRSMPWSMSAAHAEDFDEWRDRGNPGWGASDLLPVFRSLENHEGPPTALARGGRLQVTDCSKLFHPARQPFDQGGSGSRARIQSGFQWRDAGRRWAFSIDDERRKADVRRSGFLAPAMKRPECHRHHASDW